MASDEGRIEELCEDKRKDDATEEFEKPSE